jgi:ABC-2 type transport system permease protein
MASINRPLPAPPVGVDSGSAVNLIWAFVERQKNLWKRYWAWELVWLVYGVVNTLAITFIAEEAGQQQIAAADEVRNLVLFLLLGTLAWAYLSAVIDDIGLTVGWERWEGTVEHTLMAPVPRALHLTGMCVFAVLHAIVRTVLIGAVALLFFEVDFGAADWGAAALVLAVGSVSVAGLAILAGVLPLIYPERGSQMTFMVQAAILLVSGVYYSVDVLPGWMQVLSYASPATYILDGVRGAIQHGQSVRDLWQELAVLTLSGALLVPLSMAVFNIAERWAKKTGRLKRMG